MLAAALAALAGRSFWARAAAVCLVALALCGAVTAFIARERFDAADDARRDLEAEQIKEVKDAIIRSAPGPRPSGGEFVECLRRSGPGCL